MHHVTFEIKGRFQAFQGEAELRRAARLIGRVCGERLLAWALPGDHFHSLLDGSRAQAGCTGRDVRLAFRGLGTVLLEPHYREVTSRRDLENVVAYLLRQPRKHESCEKPALFSGGCFPDLVGARILDGWNPDRLLSHLPRFDPAGHLHEVAASAMPKPATDDDIRAIGAAGLASAAAAALGVAYPFCGNEAPVVAARRAAAGLGAAAGIPRSEIAFAVGVTGQAAGRMARAPRNARVEGAVRVWLGLEVVATRIERAASGIGGSQRFSR